MPGDDDSDIVEEEKHRVDGLVRILPARHRRAMVQEAIVAFVIVRSQCLKSSARSSGRGEGQTDKSERFLFSGHSSQKIRTRENRAPIPTHLLADWSQEKAFIHPLRVSFDRQLGVHFIVESKLAHLVDKKFGSLISEPIHPSPGFSTKPKSATSSGAFCTLTYLIVNNISSDQTEQGYSLIFTNIFDLRDRFD